MVDVTELGTQTSADGRADTAADGVPGPLEGDGWQKRSILDEPRLSEAVEMYKKLGFEVKVVKLDLGGVKGCSVCLDSPSDGSSVVYTRARASGDGSKGEAEEGELFD